ncbi:hypothetical protein CATMQ487_05730 [Sphaerotilus microaerophilus]|jgi:hypothetical protein|uniref:Uncharacterized protein n=1 Tax=Sphaerotilus microaerophilus TaxID=2914710 RepID=A0ABM7YHG8_9BURK|nr:hypothetical protein CATMQ487_05730 [Sphaerotilus sp. FB-5]
MTRHLDDAAQQKPAPSHGDGHSAAHEAALGAPCRRPGALKGLGQLDEGFFDPLTEEEQAAWEGGLEPGAAAAVVSRGLSPSGNAPTDARVSGETNS